MEKLNKAIEILAGEAGKLVDEIKVLNDQMAEKKKRLTAIKTKELAELMDTEGIAIGSKLSMENGKVLHVKEFFTCDIPTLTKINTEKDPEKQMQLQSQRNNAFSWLDKNGKSDIIKNTITAFFNREEGEKAKSLLKVLAEKGITCQHDENVHPGTLQATLKEALGNGEVVPLTTFNVYRGTVVDVK